MTNLITFADNNEHTLYHEGLLYKAKQSNFAAKFAAMTTRKARGYLERIFPGKADYTYNVILCMHGKGE